MEPGQVRAARALLGWGQQELADLAEVSVSTVKRLESKGPGSITYNNVQSVLTAFEKAGVVFIDRNGGGPGVRLKA